MHIIRRDAGAMDKLSSFKDKLLRGRIKRLGRINFTDELNTVLDVALSLN